MARELEREKQRAERLEQQAARKNESAALVLQHEEGFKEAESLTRELEAEVAELRQLLARHLAQRRHLALDDLAPFPELPTAPVEPAVENPPRWVDFEPQPGRGLWRRITRAERTFAEDSFHTATARWQKEREEQRSRYAEEISAYHSALHQIQTQVDEAERDRLRLQTAVTDRDQEGVAELVSRAIDLAHLPEQVRCGQQVVFRPEHRQVVVQLELPPASEAVPGHHSISYVKKTRELKRTPRRRDDMAGLYALLVAQIVLVCLDQCFLLSDLEGAFDSIILNAHVEAVDPSTGHDIHPCLVSVEADRESFLSVNLARVDPIACLRNQLNAEVSKRPMELEAVEPFLEFDKAKWRIGDPADPLVGLDSKLDLLAIHHRRFEKLVTDLLRAMDLISYNTPQSNDGGVDTVSFHKHIVSGGEFAVQSKQYRRAVPVKDIRELAGVVDVRRATRGFLVTTAWASPMAKAFARENNRVRIIEGGELKYLLREHLGIEAKIEIDAQES
ncbi:restriction endonuclease [Actinomycetospora lemnae]|uniref:Restriction endonuclease n=1 Tax=Actinomycetospora lemnae TaxID=3019891 RepID=A0ABT5SRW0_9PSEU|nr:restriction endonuclease [Actinomycetospora sp. DW7H6]MDD7965524.1 restriction endonuclease [Actinomycetospora sp. DW7H6]